MPAFPLHATLIATMLPLLLAACGTSPAGTGDARRVTDGEDFTIGAGESVMLGDSSRLRYVRVVADSRCPPGAQCVWAGDAELELEWSREGGAPEVFSVHTQLDERSHVIGERRVSLQSLATGDAPEATLHVEIAGQ